MPRSLTFILIFFSIHSLGQKFADKSYYLVDSLVYENISPEYQQLVDNSLAHYHAAKTDMDRITAVNQIVKLCWDENVWPKYNQWVYDYSSAKLNEPQTDTVRFQLLQALAGATYYIGWNYSVQTDYDKCVFYYEQCKAIYIAIGDSIGIANSLDNIGSIYLIKGELAAALDYFTKALLIRKEIGDVLGMAASLNSIGSIHLEHGDWGAALEEFEQALVLHQQVKFISGVSTALNNLGTIQYYFGNYESALRYYTESLGIKDLLEDKQGKAMSLTQIGMIHLMQQHYADATDYFTQSLNLYKEIGDKRGIAGSYLHMGLIHRLQGKFKKAISYFNQGLTLAETIGASQEKRNALEELFYTHVIMHNHDAAEKAILEIIAMRRNDVRVNFAILPEQKKELYFSTMSEDFMNLYAFASIRKQENPAITGIAFDNALKLKGLLLKSGTAMREAILTSGDATLIEKYDRWINLKKEIAAHYATGSSIEDLELRANELEKDLIKSSTAFSDFNQSDDLSWKDIQAKLKPAEAAIEFIHFTSEIGNDTAATRYAALIITTTSTHPKMIELCTAEELVTILGITQANNLTYVNDLYGTQQQSKSTLYNAIWQPMEQELSAIKTVYFSATGFLHKISFAAIRNAENEFLCDQYNLVQVSSTAQLVLSKPFEFSANSTASLFGGVKYSTEKTQHVIWNYLPGSLAEVDSIHAKLNKQMAVNFFKSEAASEEHFKEVVAQSNFIHIASHGFFYPDPELLQKKTYQEENTEEINFRGGAASYGIWNFVNNKNPLMRSGIALAGSNDMWSRGIFEEGEDGVLTAQEVTTLNMRNTDLVVLSACETGLGDIRGNEGVYGLQRAFKMAGVRYLIMSLWQVPDQETAEFMILFYTKLLVQKDIRQAFADTQKEMRTKYDPYFWAAFVLIE